ncbi:MAG: rod shape-determining protein MreD [Candidatus Aminicenantales bacterium]
MRDGIHAALGVVAAFLLFTILKKISYVLPEAMNFFTLVVIYFALTRGEIFGACLGMVCGFIIDSFSLGVFGIAGLANTITGFLTGFIAKKINVLSVMRSFLFFGLMASLELGLWIFFSFLVFSETVNTDRGLVFFQPLSTAFFGSLLFILMRKSRSRNGQ